MQFAVLGDIQFELIAYFDGLSGRFGASFAEHARIEGKPRLQWTGDTLDEWTIEAAFHHIYCDPEAEMARLRAAMARHDAMAFVLATGEYKGDFVITEISLTSKRTDRFGALTVANASLSLKEHVPLPGEEARTRQGLAVLDAGATPDPYTRVSGGGFFAPAVSTGLVDRGFDAARSLGSSVGILHGARSAQEEAWSLFSLAKEIQGDPMGAVARLVAMGQPLHAVGVGTGALASILGEVGNVLPDALPVVGTATELAGLAGEARGMVTGVSVDDLCSDFFMATQGRMTELERGIDGLHPEISRLAALAAVRGFV
uniref:Phage protein U n=1 Tax=Candidatus Kentrum sp. LFY TaxID=2126342 RepID=A0A450WGZ2_9GAMM|nr:MAG: Phage protein U [Candidatus Kentron sp. LFY]